MYSRLASWKNKLLNKPGRLTLASSVLSSIPSYYMQINWLSQSICDSIDKATRDFIWKGTDNKGINLVNWHKVTTPKHLGGLGIRTARETNTSLLGKLVWDMVQSSNKLWVQLLSNKYIGGWNFLQASIQTNSSPSWSSIIRAKNILNHGYSWHAGSGSSSFWFNNWSTHGLIGNHVPIIDIHDLHLIVKDVFSVAGLHAQELYTNLPSESVDFINSTHFRFNTAIEDSFIWARNKNGNYTTKSGYDWLLSLKVTIDDTTPHRS